jgi:redox-sensitive bicupin YhaK (pirin superfamily)
MNMIELRPLETLAEAKRDWLHARMHFDFAAMGRSDHPRMGALLVWNDDEFAPFSGFPMHFHSNVEIVTYVLEGAITHEDSLGNKGRIAAGEVQAMSAGTGVRHSEFNAETANDDTELVLVEVA